MIRIFILPAESEFYIKIVIFKMVEKSIYPKVNFAIYKLNQVLKLHHYEEKGGQGNYRIITQSQSQAGYSIGNDHIRSDLSGSGQCNR